MDTFSVLCFSLAGFINQLYFKKQTKILVSEGKAYNVLLCESSARHKVVYLGCNLS